MASEIRSTFRQPPLRSAANGFNLILGAVAKRLCSTITFSNSNQAMKLNPSHNNFPNAQSGAAAVEFALIFPFFILMMMGMAGYGIYFGASHSVRQIAADAARSSVAGLTQTERKSIVAAFVSANAGGYPFIDPQKITVETHDSTADGNQFVVSVTYDASGLPIWHLIESLAMPGPNIVAQSTIRVGSL